MKKAAVLMGSDSDFDKIKGCFEKLNAFGVPYEAHVISAHRTPERAAEFAKGAREHGFGVIICAAGMAAHLAGVIAAYTTLPVIGIPVTGTLEGLDAMLSTIMMPPGIPVATVALNGGANAAILACEILSLSDDKLAERLAAERVKMEESVDKKDEALRAKLKEV